jgi:hypothetical protein
MEKRLSFAVHPGDLFCFCQNKKEEGFILVKAINEN